MHRAALLRVGLVGAIFGVLAACGGSSATTNPTLKHGTQGGGGNAGDDGDDASAGASGAGGVSDALTDEISVFCSLTYGQFAVAFDTCCTTDADRARDEYASSIAFLETLANECNALLVAAAGGDRITIDQSAMSACTNAFATASTTLLPCGGIPADPTPLVAAACSKVVIGAGEELDQCDHGFECEDGLACIPPIPLSGSGRQCGMPPASGQPCGFALALPFGNHPQCAQGLYCDGTTGLCAKPADLGASCDDDNGCATGHCVLGACASNLAAIGKGCAVTRDCVGGAYCDGAIAPGAGGAGGAQPAGGSGGTGGQSGGSKGDAGAANSAGKGGADPSGPAAAVGTCAARKSQGASCQSNEECAGICDQQCAAFCGSQ